MLKKITAIMLIAGMAVSTLEVYAASTSKKIEETQGQIEETKGELEKVNSDIEQLEGSKEDLENKKKKFETELNEIMSEIEKLNQEIEEKQTEIEETEKSLEEAKQKEEEQYESMKVRIKYMYEHGDENYVEILLAAEDMGDMVNRAEYISKISQYDNEMFDEFVATREEIQREEIVLKKQKEELERAKVESQEQQEAMAEKVSQVKASISEYESQISEAEKRALEFEEQLRQQEESLESLERKKRQEEENARRAAENNITSNTSGIPLGSPPATVTSASNVQLLAAIIECEAGGESYEGKIAVGNVVMNRVASNRYPNTIAEVLYQRSQFTPVTSGRFVLVLSRGANGACTQAAQDVLNGKRAVGTEIYHFCRVNGTPGTIIGNHVFY
jgi:spore germination cell wall hydrolase CwlJ-like protein/uncharacterized protein YoxC